MRQLPPKVPGHGRIALLVGALTVVALVVLEGVAEAHGVSRRDASFVESIRGAAVGPFMCLGAKHMVTGYDHLLFLVGVIFFLYRLKDIFLYVSLFTIGHSVTLLVGALGGVRANPHIIDAIIGLSIVYKAFENMGGVPADLWFHAKYPRRRPGVRPLPRVRSGDEAPGLRAV